MRAGAIACVPILCRSCRGVRSLDAGELRHRLASAARTRRRRRVRDLSWLRQAYAQLVGAAGQGREGN
eukprot:174318-Pleurochrysis_carterae.AAC.1